MKSFLFVGLLLIFALSGCTQSKPVAPATSPAPTSGNAATAGEGSEVHDPPPLLEFPKADGFVNDWADVLSEKEEQDLEAVLNGLQARAKIDFAIAMVTNTGEKNIFDYSLAMAKEWKVGSENGGILFVTAVGDRKWYIQITKNLEDDLTEAEVKSIGDVAVPDFKAGKYGEGIKKCVNKMIAELAKKQKFEPIMVK